LRESWRTIYRRIDDGIGRLVDAAGPDATVLVLASHGMGPYVGGYQLLPPFLSALGLGPQPARVAAAGRSVPPGLRRRILRLVPRRVRRRALRSIGVHYETRWLEDPANRAAAVIIGRVGGIRLNVHGRDPVGTVAPGAEADRLTDDLRRELLALRVPGTAEPVVREVVTAEEAFGPDHHPDVPDLIVIFRRDIGPIEAAESARVGLLRRAVSGEDHPRTGDHTGVSRLWAVGAGVTAGSSGVRADTLDVAPTVLRLLDVPVPPDYDGSAIDLTATPSGHERSRVRPLRTVSSA
jgi:predicted AlkP superfamily phosphohydrolase/phosphomutase